MKYTPQLISTAGRNRTVSRALVVFAAIALATASQAATTTGVPQGNSFGWLPNSTNALNFADMAPGREGQGAPYVLFDSNTPGSVTLDFFNQGNNGFAFFETRIDGIATGVNPHPVVIGDTIHTGGIGLNSPTTEVGVFPVGSFENTFTANSYVDIRLALGGERDYDFDWVRFDVAPAASVPDGGGTLALLSLGLAGIGYARRKK